MCSKCPGSQWRSAQRCIGHQDQHTSHPRHNVTYSQNCQQGKRRYRSYMEVEFSVLCPTRATLCTDKDKIWR